MLWHKVASDGNKTTTTSTAKSFRSNFLIISELSFETDLRPLVQVHRNFLAPFWC